MPRTRNTIRDATAKDLPDSNSKGKEMQTRKISRANVGVDKRYKADIKVLRDITHQYLESALTRKRKGNMSTHITVTAAAPKLNRMESSLPPSSPPSTSSQIPVAAPYDYPEINPLTSDPIDAGPNAAEDPFGFLAVEEQLKAKRRTRALTAPWTVRVTSSDSTDEPADESLWQAFATPKPIDSLRTPRKRTNARKRKLELSTPSSSPRVGSEVREGERNNLPSTPSPVKAKDRSVEVDRAQKDPDNVAKRTGKEVVQRGRKKSKPNEADMNPKELARNLEALLPRRPKPKTGFQRGRVRSKKVPIKSDDEGNTKQKGGKGKTQERGTAKDKQDMEESDGEDEAERLRQIRIDYFKKVDGYEVQKEDIYIV